LKHASDNSPPCYQKRRSRIREHCDLQLLISLLLGALLAIARRRTVTQWLRAAQISDDFRLAFYHIPNIGCKGDAELQVAMLPIFDAMIKITLEELASWITVSSNIRIVLDDSPTKRYGRKVEGAGYHHNPTPGPAKKGRGRPKTYGERIAMKAMVEDKKG